VELEGSIERLLEGEPWSAAEKQQQHQKQNLLGKRKPVSWLRRPRVPKLAWHRRLPHRWANFGSRLRRSEHRSPEKYRGLRRSCFAGCLGWDEMHRSFGYAPIIAAMLEFYQALRSGWQWRCSVA